MFAGYRASRQASTPTHADRCASAVNRASSSASRSLGARAGERAPPNPGAWGKWRRTRVGPTSHPCFGGRRPSLRGPDSRAGPSSHVQGLRGRRRHVALASVSSPTEAAFWRLVAEGRSDQARAGSPGAAAAAAAAAGRCPTCRSSSRSGAPSGPRAPTLSSSRSRLRRYSASSSDFQR
jgi:hypothetical protein